MSSEELLVIDVETGEKVNIFNNFGKSYDWSPDSSQIVHGRDLQWSAGGSAKAEGLWTTNILSGQNQRLVPPDSGLPLTYPKWSPDGRHIAFHEIVYPEGFGPFAVADLDSTNYGVWKRQVGFFDWSPDGQQIVFDNLVYSYEDPGIGLFIADNGGTNERILVGGDSLIAVDPHWSPDGQYIAFINGKDWPASLWVIKPDGSELQQLSDTGLGGINAISWSPESKRIVVSSDQGINILSLTADPPLHIGKGSCPDWQK
jgi:Tol biopolymer transport system component